MSKLIYITNMSLDGYIEDQNGDFNWGNPEQLHPIVVELLQPVGTYIYGRRLYEAMAEWDGPVDNWPLEYRAFAAMWQKPEKLVFSRTLTAARTRNTHIERDFDAEAIRTLKRESKDDISIGGAELATLALENDLVDECHLLVHPVIFGGGKPAFGADLRRKLELIETRRVGTGVLYLRYRSAARKLSK